MRVSRPLCADGKSAIFCVDYLPAKLIAEPDYQQEDLEPPISHFLNKICHTNVETNLAELRVKHRRSLSTASAPTAATTPVRPASRPSAWASLGRIWPTRMTSIRRPSPGPVLRYVQ